MLVARDNATYAFQELNITLLPGGQLVMLIRTQDKVRRKTVLSFLTRSQDGVLRRTNPVQTEINASSRHQLLISTGSLLLTYGTPVARRPDVRSPHHRPCRLVERVPKDATCSSGHDEANPSGAEIAPGPVPDDGVQRRHSAAVGLRDGGHHLPAVVAAARSAGGPGTRPARTGASTSATTSRARRIPTGLPMRPHGRWTREVPACAKPCSSVRVMCETKR